MKILLVSMNSIHFRRWSDQLQDSGHEVYWFDILDQGYAPSMSWMTQITGWKKGFLKKRGRTFIKNKLPRLFNALVHKYDTKLEDAFAKAAQEIQPDVVHSFALYTSCLPILDVMNKHRNLKWIYSSWGSDLFNRDNKPDYQNEVTAVLKRVDYLITDCERDEKIANNMGFKGKHLGVFPGGGGFEQRKVILERNPLSFVVKGYENDLGKAIPVIQALIEISQVYDIEVTVFGATKRLLKFLEESDSNGLRLNCYENISHDDVLKLMDQASYYIGNSISDGMPNTLLEAIYCGCIPIQSNPGGATEELVKHGVNGYLINDPKSILHIKEVILESLVNPKRGDDFYKVNETLRTRFDRSAIQNEVLITYKSIIR